MELRKYKLSQLLSIKNGKDYKHLDNGDVPVFGSGGFMCSVNSYLYDKVSILLPRKGTLSNIQFYNHGRFWTVDTCFYSIVNESLCDPYYLYRYIKSLDLSGYDTGASIPSMTQKTYNGIKVSLPSLPTQHRIASILSAYDNLIENNNKRIRLLEQMAENLYKEWFVRFRFPGHEKVEME
ncbi:MAG: restriction endonuclease subunit S, partial [Paludibacteraceae bacterium]|nr:restriction endonuclease subunit S [Paludibacteraceae bacterium]